MPDAVERFKISDAILGNDRDAVAAGELAVRAQCSAEARDARGERAIIEDHALAERDGRTGRMTFPGAFKPQCNVHGRINTFAVSAILNVQPALCCSKDDGA